MSTNQPLLHAEERGDAKAASKAPSKPKLTSTQKQRIEDFYGMAIAFTLFILALVLAFQHQNLKDYETHEDWPLGAIGVSVLIIIGTHYLLALNDGQQERNIWKAISTAESYAFALLIAVLSRSIGTFKCFQISGLTASFWAIVLGMFFHACGVKLNNQVKSGEYFIKIGVTLLTMDYMNIIEIGGPGLVVAWVDTALVLSIGYIWSSRVIGLPKKDSMVVAGATSICGSSAATAIATVLYPGESEGDKKSRSQIVDPIVALMGLLNTPLMPLLPIANKFGSLNEAVTGAWIGGCIDSTGQVVASASLASDHVLQTATIVKIAQNFLIGPICLVLSVWFGPMLNRSGSFDSTMDDVDSDNQVRGCFDAIRIICKQFPVFVFGFFITSAVVTIINHATHGGDSNVHELVISNSWTIAEWVNLIGFACIGLKIDIFSLFKKSNVDEKQSLVLNSYLLIQAVDILTTLGFAYLMFHGRKDFADDDNNGDDIQ